MSLAPSLPVRERGLKSVSSCYVVDRDKVAPRAGAWIEIFWRCLLWLSVFVAPRAGAWIEILWTDRGAGGLPVAPRAGAWIEIALPGEDDDEGGRSPCGSVD